MSKNIAYIGSDEESSDNDEQIEVPIRELDISRTIYMQSEFDEEACKTSSIANEESVKSIAQQIERTPNFLPKLEKNDDGTIREKIEEKCINCQCNVKCIKSVIKKRIPMISTLISYNFRDDLIGDVSSGLTIGVMQIPQGMAYALLADLQPIYGLYTAFFPVIIYALLASSRHLSQGAFAITCLMTASAIHRMVDENPNLNTNKDKIQIAATIAFITGIIHVFMFICKLGFISNYLSPTLVRGLTCGASVHVLTSQISTLLGISVKKYSGVFKIPKNWYEILTHLHESNHRTIIMSLLAIFILALIKEAINKKFKAKLKIPVPAELTVVLLGTILSKYLDMEEKYGISIVGDIPKGLPVPTIFPLSYIPKLIQDSVIIAIITYSISYSMAETFADQFSYSIDPNQELLAYGCSNIFGCFFSCFSMGASMARTAVQVSSGCKSQLTTIFSAIFLLFVLLFIGPYFSTLPTCCLAAIIVVALKGMIREMTNFPSYWQMNRYEGLVWLLTFLSVVIFDVDIGLGIGVFSALFLIVVLHQMTNMAILGNLPNTEIFRNVKYYQNSEESNGVKIVKFQNNIFYANTRRFQMSLYEAINMNVEKEYLKKKKDLLKLKKLQNENPNFSRVSFRLPNQLYVVILDCGSINYMDSSAVKMLEKMINELEELDIEILLSQLKPQPLQILRKNKFYERKCCEKFPRFFVTTMDALLFARKHVEKFQ
ncbi:hypothetical protein SNEBB_005217 [Seison nebaliae]|nr:hypothetical protein SNEBB_005217 [Seison nebaliae]